MSYLDYMQAMQRDDGAMGCEEIISEYCRQIEELRAAVAGMSAEQLHARPIAEKWSSLEVVAHLADTEIYFSDRMLRTIAMKHPLLVGVDEREYPARLNYPRLEIAEELELFAALRRHVGRILKMQPAEAWERTAVHTQTGLLTLRQLVLNAVRHTRHHLPFIAEKRLALRANGGVGLA